MAELILTISPRLLFSRQKNNKLKHGPALLLHGLEKDKKDNSLIREIIIPGANYVSKFFMVKFGQLGRSYGCLAFPQKLISTLVPLLANGSLLYIHS